MIDITKVNLTKFVKDVYELSVPQGMGWLHARDGGLSDEDVKRILDTGDMSTPIFMDYVHGRACKMTVFNRDSKLVMNDAWYDHTTEQLQELLKRHDLEAPEAKHGVACNCSGCQLKRKEE